MSASTANIGEETFAGSTVQIVNVPSSVTSIADDAFSNCNVTVYCSTGSYSVSWRAAYNVNCVTE